MGNASDRPLLVSSHDTPGTSGAAQYLNQGREIAFTDSSGELWILGKNQSEP